MRNRVMRNRERWLREDSEGRKRKVTIDMVLRTRVRREGTKRMARETALWVRCCLSYLWRWWHERTGSRIPWRKSSTGVVAT